MARAGKNHGPSIAARGGCQEITLYRQCTDSSESTGAATPLEPTMKVFGTMKKRHVCSALLVLAAALAFAHAQAPAVNPTGGPVVTCTTGVFDCQNAQLMAAFDETGESQSCELSQSLPARASFADLSLPPSPPNLRQARRTTTSTTTRPTRSGSWASPRSSPC